MTNPQILNRNIAIGIASLLLLTSGVLAYSWQKDRKVIDLKSGEIAGLQSEVETLKTENTALSEALYSEKNKNQVFEDQIKEIAGTVGLLDKLSKTDPELLQKYSKVYFLNEHYTPAKLVTISKASTYPENKEMYIHRDVFDFLHDMIDEAEEDGVDLRVISAYRSFDTQAALKSSYKVTYGTGANQFSADQGYSEHQLGTTVDLTTPVNANNFENFDNTEAFKWLKNNGYKFGFILSYPDGNSYYQYEPWHWRFVGRKLAQKLHEDDMSFYDMDQRTIDTYLVNLFD